MAGDWLVRPGGKRLAATTNGQQHFAGTVCWNGNCYPPDLAEQALFRAHGHVPPAFAFSAGTGISPAISGCIAGPPRLLVAAAPPLSQDAGHDDSARSQGLALPCVVRVVDSPQRHTMMARGGQWAGEALRTGAFAMIWELITLSPARINLRRAALRHDHGDFGPGGDKWALWRTKTSVIMPAARDRARCSALSISAQRVRAGTRIVRAPGCTPTVRVSPGAMTSPSTSRGSGVWAIISTRRAWNRSSIRSW
jgi:hypothetical protein